MQLTHALKRTAASRSLVLALGRGGSFCSYFFALLEVLLEAEALQESFIVAAVIAGVSSHVAVGHYESAS